MSPLWRGELTVGIAPGRLVAVERRPFSRRLRTATGVVSDPVAEVKTLARGMRLAVVLSNHFVRYTVLAWSEALRSPTDWESYAAHAFSSTYGASASSWAIRVSGGGRGYPRIACAVDRELLDGLRATPNLVSVQPYFAAAFNARRRLLAGKSSWFVVQEPGRTSYGLIEADRWKLIRTRRPGTDWRASLLDAIAREEASNTLSSPKHVAVCSEEEGDFSGGGYKVTDVSLAGAARKESRTHLMAMH